jgi:hypothetical protein
MGKPMPLLNQSANPRLGRVLPAFLLAAGLCAGEPLAATPPVQEPPEPTRVVVLGVSHAAQLVSRGQQGAAIRAFLDKVEPAAIGIERDPDSFARGDHYEFTYEIQDVIVPYALERGIPLHPFDWVPPMEDQRLGLGLDLETPPEVRPLQGFGSFLTFTDPEELGRDLFFADDPEHPAMTQVRAFTGTPAPSAGADYPRRLFLYRTWHQARRVLHMARAHPGSTVVVVVGYFHKEDLEAILSASPGLTVEQPSEFGLPGDEEVQSRQSLKDLHAIAYMNLLALQSEAGVVDREWLAEVLDRLESSDPSLVVQLYRIRWNVLFGGTDPSEARTAYLALAAQTPEDLRFPWSGVKDAGRVDSYVDPFGNLGVRARLLLEAARGGRTGEPDEIETIRAEIEQGLFQRQRAQFAAYWERHLAPDR